MRVLRYDGGPQIVMTPLNPIEDVMSWLCGLRSRSYTSGILEIKHGMSSASEIRRCAGLVSEYAEGSVGFLEQAYSGPPEVSFLPLYYGLLNLSKIYVILSGRRGDLPQNRYHGASYDPMGKSSRDLLTEEITLRRSGVLPLFYEVLTDMQWVWERKRITLRDVYPYIWGVTYEFKHAYNEPPAMQVAKLIIQETTGRYRLVLELGESPHANANNPRYLKLLAGFRRDPSRPRTFVSHEVSAASEDQARESLLRDVRRYLLYDVALDRPGTPISVTVLSSKRLLLPEELPIWLAFFHLSSVVRYRPEFLSKLRDSRSWPMLLALGRHSVLRFLLLFWSYLHQTTFLLTVS